MCGASSVPYDTNRVPSRSTYVVMAHIVMAHEVMAYIVMAYVAVPCLVIAHTVMAYIVMAYIVTAYLVMVYIVMAHMVMAHIVMAHQSHPEPLDQPKRSLAGRGSAVLASAVIAVLWHGLPCGELEHAQQSHDPARTRIPPQTAYILVAYVVMAYIVMVFDRG